MKSALGALIVLTAFYLCTASLSFQGPGEMLVFRPFPGVFPRYCVLDSDHTALAAYNGRLPWWQSGDYIPLHYTSHETTSAPWEVCYGLGYYTTILGWVTWLFALVIRARRTSERHIEIAPSHT
jgi:hypothetical protein